MKRFEISLTVRGYELGATGRVSAATLLRYTEQARWSSMAAPGFGASRFWSRGMLRAEQIAIESPVVYGDDVVIATWIGHVGRTSLTFVHQLTRAKDGAVLALASAVGVVVDAAGRPSPVAEGAREIVVPEPGPQLPDLAGDAPAGAFVREFAALPSDHDILQHVNHARWVDHAEDTRLLGAIAGGHGAASEAGKKAAGRLSIEFKKQAVAGERLIGKSWPLDAAGASFGTEIRLADGDAVAVRARVET